MHGFPVRTQHRGGCALHMTILLFTTSPRRATGGVETVYRMLAASLRQGPHVVHEMHMEDRAYHEKREGGDIWGVPLEYPRTRHRLPRPASVLRCGASLVRLAARLARIRPDVVNVHYVDARAAYFALLKPLFGYRLVLSAHGSDLLAPTFAVDTYVLPFLLRAADAVTVVSQKLADQAMAIAPAVAAKVSVIVNGIDVDFWANGAARTLAAPLAETTECPPPTIIHVGRLERVKGQDVLLRALPAVLARKPACRLVLVGEGSEKQALRALTVELGIAAAVTFAGLLAPAEVRRRLHAATVFAFPSRSEGLGLALIEAMATGLPPVASDVGGVPEVITEGETGLLVPPEDAAALSATLLRLLDDAEQRSAMSARARDRAKAFRWSATAEAYASVFRHTLDLAPE